MWVILTFLAAVGLVFLEVFLPGGVLGVIGVLTLLASMGLGFYSYGAVAGMAILTGELIGAGLLLMGLLKLFPHTRIGRTMILHTELDTAAGYVGTAEELQALVGTDGTAETDLRPAGMARILGKRIDAVADGEFIERGQPVEVTQVEGNRVVVRARLAGPETATDPSTSEATS